MDFSLLGEMMQRLSVAATLAFVLSQTAVFRRIVNRQVTFGDRAVLAVLFGFIGIVGTYAGIPVDHALANSRVVGVMAAGLIGGRMMGVAAGLIAGGHRFLLGGFTAFSCALANVLEGLLGGFVRRWYPGRPIPWWLALGAGIAGETLQMAVILVTARPYDMALALVQKIAVPMIVTNSLGIAIFMLIIKTVMEAEQKIGAEQSQKALAIATQTLSYLRHGLTPQSAQAAARIILATHRYDAVAITDTEKVLAFIGNTTECCAKKRNMLSDATVKVLQSGNMLIAQIPQEIGCASWDCKLASVIIVPLKRAGLVTGTLKLYYVRPNAVKAVDREFAAGVAHLFSTQLELAEIDRQAKLASRAELKALYAQINPHFLFNTLNTISSLIRTKPDLARELLLKFSAIFRHVLHKTGRNITIAEELSQVEAYLSIEQARYGDKLAVREDISPGVEKYLIPSLTVQPLVENAIRHGLQPKEEGGCIFLRIVEREREIEISVKDNGVGMDLAVNHPLSGRNREGIGLVNVHERLRGQYGASWGLTLQSQRGKGTTVTMRLPKLLQEEGEDIA
ncbi:signal transduction histidine kinase internal region [Lucifera butyrica]|uniref:histidine kinase n=1 Tax=Lucifera butyrica TaxID=1351585 RepID=A0A498R711_9FIRM|nr:sensor histidine kinase [Lucifera butyrica]VBB05953.1 signal transduction histidine kinase internal region [Lucifera butyrica]